MNNNNLSNKVNDICDELKDEPPTEQELEFHRLRGEFKHLYAHVEKAGHMLKGAMSRELIPKNEMCYVSKKDLDSVLDVLKKAPTI